MTPLQRARERLEAFVLGAPNNVLPDTLTTDERDRLMRLRMLEDDVEMAIRLTETPF